MRRMCCLLLALAFCLSGCGEAEQEATSVTIQAGESTVRSAPVQDGTMEVRREPDDVTVYPFPEEALSQAETVIEAKCAEWAQEPGTLRYEVESIAFDPLMTDVRILQHIADNVYPNWDMADYYSRMICYAVTYSAEYDHEKTFLSDAQHDVFQVTLIRTGDGASWSYMDHGVPVEEHSHQAMSANALSAVTGLEGRILAGYQVDQEFWLYVVEEGETAVEQSILPWDQVWDESGIQVGDPVTPQPGDTQATWNPEIADQYPDDAECTALELLEKWMAVEGLTIEDLNERQCNQLILVTAQPDRVSTITTCYHRNDPCSDWTPVEVLTSMSGWVGENGVRHGRLRNSVTSPAGLWSLGLAFGNAEKPEGLKMPWRNVTANSDWVCDENSIYFNTWQERDSAGITQIWDLNEGEHLEDYPNQYAYACVIRYNTPPYTISERGCAIFLHCSTGPTGGCIGLAEDDLVQTLLWLDPAENPYILITGQEAPTES